MTVTNYNNRCFALGNNKTVYKTITGTAGDVFAEGEAIMRTDAGTFIKWTQTSGKKIFGFIAPNCGVTIPEGETTVALVGITISGDIDINVIVLPSGLTTASAFYDLKEYRSRIENLAAGGDISARAEFINPTACTLVSAGIELHGATAGIDGSNTAVVAVADLAGNSIVSKTYGATPPEDNKLNDLGTLSSTHKVLTANEAVTLAVTQGTTADLPSFDLVLTYIQTTKTILDTFIDEGRFFAVDREQLTK